MSERSEFGGPPADDVRSEGTPKGRRGGCASLLTFLSHNKKVSRPPGRNPGRSRHERSPRQTNSVRSQKTEQSAVSHSTLSSSTAQRQTHRIRISSSDASTAHTLFSTIRNIRFLTLLTHRAKTTAYPLTPGLGGPPPGGPPGEER